MGAPHRSSLLVGLAAVAFASAVSGASANVAGGLRRLPPALCSQLLDNTYGALQGWTPTEGQLRAMCKGLMVHKMKVVRTASSASGPCQAFSSSIASEVSAAHSSHTRLPSLSHLKEKWCPRSLSPPSSQAGSAVHDTPVTPSPEDADPDSWWPAAPSSKDVAQPVVRHHTATLTAVAAGVGHSGHHHRRHKVLQHAPLDAATMLKLRQDLLAGRDEAIPTVHSENLRGGVDSQSPPGGSVEALQVKAAVTKSASDEAEPAEVNATKDKGGHPPLGKTSLQHPLVLLQGLASNTVSWFGTNLASALDFVCDGRCQSHKRRTVMIVN